MRPGAPPPSGRRRSAGLSPAGLSPGGLGASVPPGGFGGTASSAATSDGRAQRPATARERIVSFFIVVQKHLGVWGVAKSPKTLPKKKRKAGGVYDLHPRRAPQRKS